VQQGGKQRPVGRGEADLLAVQLPFEDHDLVPQREDLRVLDLITQGQQPKHRERLAHTELRQSKKHSPPSSKG
jgi:hypothetical protein